MNFGDELALVTYFSGGIVLVSLLAVEVSSHGGAPLSFLWFRSIIHGYF